MRTNRRKHPQDALRWLMAVFVSAVIASAITSAIFLTARPDSPEIEPHNQQAQAAREVAQLLLPELEAFAQQQLQDNQQVAPQRVEVVYHVEPPQGDGEVPMVAPERRRENLPYQANCHLKRRTVFKSSLRPSILNCRGINSSTSV